MKKFLLYLIAIVMASSVAWSGTIDDLYNGRNDLNHLNPSVAPILNLLDDEILPVEKLLKFVATLPYGVDVANQTMNNATITALENDYFPDGVPRIAISSAVFSGLLATALSAPIVGGLVELADNRLAFTGIGGVVDFLAICAIGIGAGIFVYKDFKKQHIEKQKMNTHIPPEQRLHMRGPAAGEVGLFTLKFGVEERRNPNNPATTTRVKYYIKNFDTNRPKSSPKAKSPSALRRQLEDFNNSKTDQLPHAEGVIEIDHQGLRVINFEHGVFNFNPVGQFFELTAPAGKL